MRERKEVRDMRIYNSILVNQDGVEESATCWAYIDVQMHFPAPERMSLQLLSLTRPFLKQELFT